MKLVGWNQADTYHPLLAILDLPIPSSPWALSSKTILLWVVQKSDSFKPLYWLDFQNHLLLKNFKKKLKKNLRVPHLKQQVASGVLGLCKKEGKKMDLSFSVILWYNPLPVTSVRSWLTCFRVTVLPEDH